MIEHSRIALPYLKRNSPLLTRYFSCLVLMLMGLTISAQTVSGTVTSDKDRSSLIGATVYEKGTSNGTITDIDGNFSLQVAKFPATLEISYIGYTTQEFQLTSAQEGLQISLSEGALLDEVVVTAFGMTREKKSLPYSVTQIDGGRVQEVRTANI